MTVTKFVLVGAAATLVLLGVLAPAPVLASDTGTTVVVTVNAATTDTPSVAPNNGVVLLEDAAYTSEPRNAALPTAGDSGQLIVSLGVLAMSLTYLSVTIYQQRPTKA